jgi:leucyl-tRNA synthetase
MEADEQSLYRVMHHSIKGATRDMERFHFNTAISRIMELVNELYRYIGQTEGKRINPNILSDALKNLVLLLAPMTPHISEELWHMLGEKPSVFDHSWPEYDEQALVQDEITWVIQVNGKIRERVSGKAEMDQETAKAFALQQPRIDALLQDKIIRKVIVVPKKLINIVAN